MHFLSQVLNEIKIAVVILILLQTSLVDCFLLLGIIVICFIGLELKVYYCPVEHLTCFHALH